MEDINKKKKWTFLMNISDIVSYALYEYFSSDQWFWMNFEQILFNS